VVILNDILQRNLFIIDMIKLRTNPTYNRFILKVAQLKKNINLKNNLILHIIRYSKINIIRFIQNSWTFPISINIYFSQIRSRVQRTGTDFY